MTGNTVRDNDTGMLLFDETMFLECKNGEDACWWLSVNSQTSDYNGKGLLRIYLFKSTT